MDHSSRDSPEASTLEAVGNIRIRGRTFTPEELLKIRTLVETSAGDHRFALSKRVCEELSWVQHNGRLKDRSCRDVLRRLDDMGWIHLPRPRRPSVRRRRVEITARSAPRPLPALVRWISNPLHFSSSAEQAMWNVSGCGTSTPNGTTTSATVCRWVHTSNIFVTVAGEPMACLSFAGAAWRVEARDRWIGWNGEQRERN